jgi:hypothetical protein
VLIELAKLMAMPAVAAAANPPDDGFPGNGFDLRAVSDSPDPPHMMSAAVDQAGN